MAVGLPLKTTYADGDVFSASDINDTNGTINTTAAPFAAGKNKIINGDFTVNQRQFTSNTANNSFNFDRWLQSVGGTTGTLTTTPQTFTLGAAPVVGYEGSTFVQCVTASGVSSDTFALLIQRIEDVRTFAGQTATLSFWAKAGSGTPKVSAEFVQSFGTGGSPSGNVFTYAGQSTISTSWARYSITVAIPSISGKTIGTVGNSTFLALQFWFSGGSTFNSRTGSIGLQNNTFQIWGVQLEAGSTATPFQTASGSLGGELSLCQRYYFRTGIGNGVTVRNNFDPIGYGSFADSTTFVGQIQFPVTMRAVATSLEFSNVAINDTAAVIAGTGAFVNAGGVNLSNIIITVASGGNAFRFGRIVNNNTSTGYLAWSAELT